MSEERTRIRRRLVEDGEKTTLFFEALGPTDWERQVYTTGSRWVVRNVLAHFVSAERAFVRLMEDVVQGGQGAPQDFDIDTFNETEAPKLSAQPVEALIADYRKARQATVRFVEKLRASDLSRSGFHPWFGVVELRKMLKLVYRHNMIHLRDVRRALDTGRPVPHLDVTPPTAAAKEDHP